MTAPRDQKYPFTSQSVAELTLQNLAKRIANDLSQVIKEIDYLHVQLRRLRNHRTGVEAQRDEIQSRILLAKRSTLTPLLKREPSTENVALLDEQYDNLTHQIYETQFQIDKIENELRFSRQTQERLQQELHRTNNSIINQLAIMDNKRFPPPLPFQDLM